MESGVSVTVIIRLEVRPEVTGALNAAAAPAVTDPLEANDEDGNGTQ
jgi:hypothetical protein